MRHLIYTKNNLSYIGVKVYYSDVCVCVFFFINGVQTYLTLAPVCLLLTSAQSVFFFVSDSNLRAEDLSPGNNCCSTSSFFPPLLLFFWGRGEWDRERRKHLPLLLPPDSDAHRPQYSDKSRRCFTLSPPFASRVITYHQSKLIIADWVGVVNDYRRGRTGAVSLAPFCSQW